MSSEWRDCRDAERITVTLGHSVVDLNRACAKPIVDYTAHVLMLIISVPRLYDKPLIGVNRKSCTSHSFINFLVVVPYLPLANRRSGVNVA